MNIRTVLAWLIGSLLGAKCFMTFYGPGGTITIDTNESFYLVIGAFVIAGASLAKVALDLITGHRSRSQRVLRSNRVVKSA